MQCLIMVSFIVIWQRGVDVYIVLSGLFYISAAKKEKKIISIYVGELNEFKPLNVPFPAKMFLCFVHGVMKLPRLRNSATDR